MQSGGGKMAASAGLERSFTELSGAEREAPRKYRELTVRAGVSPVPGSVKYNESAGGFYYEESNKLLSITRNRFIHWTSAADTLELVEDSLDVNLLNNAVRLKIPNCSLLPGGVHICETQSHVVILIVSNQTLHRLLLPHPARMYRSELVIESQVQSIFTDIGKVNFLDPLNYQLIPTTPGLAPNSCASAAWLGSDGEALFALPSACGGIFIFQMPPLEVPGPVSMVELKQSSVMQRLLTGWMPTAIRGDQGLSDLPISLLVHCLGHDAFLFALCQDHKLRMWSYKETYLETLFTPGRFTNEALLKALQIFRRGTGRVMDFSWVDLKKEVTIAVENELHSSVTEYEFSQEEFRQLQIDFWSKFYACCLQYQEALSRPLALLVNSQANMVCLLKKGFLSFLVPCSMVDHLYLVSDEQLVAEDESVISEDADVARDVVFLVQCLRLIGESISVEMAYLMETSCCHLLTPESTAEQILEDLIANDTDNIMQDLHNKLQDVKNPTQAIGVLLREMDYQTDVELEKTFDPAQPLNVRLNISQLFGSVAAAHVVCQAVVQIANTRFMICRDLLILQQLLLKLGDSVFSGRGQLLHVQQDLVQRTSHLLSTYYVIRWASQCLASAVPVDALDFNLRLLTVLDLSDTTGVSPPLKSGPQTAVELFFEDTARKHIISHIFSQPGTPLSNASLNWPHLITLVTSFLMQQIWPSNPGFLFAECLMGSCQYTQLQEYVRLVQCWCQVNVGSCRFVMGQCYLITGEGHKALDCFCEAASEVTREDFLQRLIRVEDQEAEATPQLQYYLKVIRMLEEVNLSELVINLATVAITAATADDWRNQAALRMRIFSRHLDLGDNNRAYEALTQIPDPGRQQDCLRQLVVVLCERSQLQDLVEFPFLNLHNEVVGIIESRARTVDLMTHNYYELLYAFHIYRHNYRKAGTVMFEYGMRLGREVRTLRGLQKQVNSYLASLNCLRLIRPEYAWIVRPSSGATNERPGSSPKRSHDGETTLPTTRQIEILELPDLEKEYVLARTRLTLAQHDPSTAAVAGSSAADEILALLVQAGLFDTAVSLCQTFQLDLTPVFEGLAFKCIKLQFGGEAAQAEAWDWLAANQLSTIITTKESSATDEAWRLLSSYLEKHKSLNCPYHQCVIKKLLSHGVPLPNWLVNSYKAVDTAELLRLYLNYDLLTEAAELILEYVDALLGKGHQYFGIERPLSGASPMVWLPYSAIDHLLQALGENPSNQHNVAVHKKLRDKLEGYLQKVDTATRDLLFRRH
ncbi:nuclear pore complex protein Nup160 [Pleurodeles waltl]|uniref:nuclear pore complex protein Nup160 n=1 Tax=Pleurodeles waltl TaxID=8319 RepID=UPI0037094C77